MKESGGRERSGEAKLCGGGKGGGEGGGKVRTEK